MGGCISALRADAERARERGREIQHFCFNTGRDAREEDFSLWTGRKCNYPDIASQYRKCCCKGLLQTTVRPALSDINQTEHTGSTVIVPIVISDDAGIYRQGTASAAGRSLAGVSPYETQSRHDFSISTVSLLVSYPYLHRLKGVSSESVRASIGGSLRSEAVSSSS